MYDFFAPAPSSVCAFVSTVHAALLMIHLDRHRGLWRLAAGPAVAFGVLAWILTTPAWLAAGVGVNLAWTILSGHAAGLEGRRTESAAGGSVPAPPPGSPTRQPAPAAPPSFVPATVLAVIDETDSIRTFRFARPPGFDFQPGQFLMVRVEAGGQTNARCYSISSAPGVAGYLEVSVRRQGLVSGALHDTVRPGGTLFIHRPLGRFTGPGDPASHAVLLAGGIGITPLISMLRHAVTTQPHQKVTLLYSVRTPRDAAFRDELEWLARRHPQVRVVMTVSGEPAPGLRQGRIDAALIGDTVPEPTAARYFLCGPLPMIDALREILTGLGVPRDHIRYEAFEAAVAVAAGTDRVAEAPASPARLRLSESGLEIEVRASETLLEAAERAGARLPSLCRAGICGTCRTRVASGDVRCTAEALTTEDRDHGYVLPCVAWAAGECVLEA